MPNHCDQDLFVTGPKDALAEFVEFSREKKDDRETVLSHNKYIPYPERYAKMDQIAAEARKNMKPGDDWSKLPKDGYNSGGYDWCVNNWGTKWGIYDDVQVYHRKNRAKYKFQSAWSPASKIILAMSEKFPTLRFVLKYYECGMGYKGVFEVKGGEVVVDQVDNHYRGSRGG